MTPAMLQDVSGTRGDAEASFDQDDMLDDTMLYWLPRAGTSSARLYWEMQQGRTAPPSPEHPLAVPVGFSMLPLDHVRKTRRWLERRYTHIVHFNQPDRGGHFAALEQPGVFTDDVRATFAPLR
jgi:pimeloyl-ACP methyl ester carboxylesterase